MTTQYETRVAHLAISLLLLLTEVPPSTTELLSGVPTARFSPSGLALDTEARSSCRGACLWPAGAGGRCGE